jgi:hypothetical protein
MTDPSDALRMFERDIDKGRIPLQRCELDRDLYVCLDEVNGKPRFNYLRLQSQKVTTLVMITTAGSVDAAPCFQIGVAVPEQLRNQGRAKSAVSAAIREFQHGFARINAPDYYIEAIVANDNVASQNVAAATISTLPKRITDQITGLPALQYLRKITAERVARVT